MIKILDIKIDQITLSETLTKITDWIKTDKQYHIATVNPEFVMAAQKDEEFKQILNQTDLSVCDGFGLVLASGFKLKRITGVDLSDKLLSGEVPEAKLYALGGLPGAAEIVAQKYKKTVVGLKTGGDLNEEIILSDQSEVLQDIKKSGANILLVAFGQIKQEKWIKNNLAKLPNIKVAIGVGGTLDFLSGKITRAPKLIRILGLEWLYRLIKEPRRIKRIWNATIRFTWLILKHKK